MNSVHTLSNSTTARFLGKSLTWAGAATLVLSSVACNKADDGRTAGQKVDSAIAKTGQVAADAKAKAEAGVASADGTMKNAGSRTETTAETTTAKLGNAADDMTITASVKANLAKSPDLSALKIDVDTKGGAVTLTGTAPSASARDKATSIAKGVKGVGSVDNKLVVKAG
jgi:hyperosmotically inducible periplasmic protein